MILKKENHINQQSNTQTERFEELNWQRKNTNTHITRNQAKAKVQHLQKCITNYVHFEFQRPTDNKGITVETAEAFQLKI